MGIANPPPLQDVRAWAASLGDNDSVTFCASATWKLEGFEYTGGWGGVGPLGRVTINLGLGAGSTVDVGTPEKLGEALLNYQRMENETRLDHEYRLKYGCDRNGRRMY
jgi:hypothetical protein